MCVFCGNALMRRADGWQYVLPSAFLLYKGTPVVTAGYMLGFLPQWAGCLTVSCAQLLIHTYTNTGTHTYAWLHTRMYTCTCWCMRRHAGTGHPSPGELNKANTHTQTCRIRHKQTDTWALNLHTHTWWHLNMSFYCLLSVCMCLRF